MHCTTMHDHDYTQELEISFINKWFPFLALPLFIFIQEMSDESISNFHYT